MMIHSYNNKGGPDGGSSLYVFIGISLGISFLLLFLIILIILGITLKKKQGEKIIGCAFMLATKVYYSHFYTSSIL